MTSISDVLHEKWIELSTNNETVKYFKDIPTFVPSEFVNQYTIKSEVINNQAVIDLSRLPITGTNYLKSVKCKYLSNIKSIALVVNAYRLDYLYNNHLIFNKLKKIFHCDDPYTVPFPMLLFSKYIPIPSSINLTFHLTYLKPSMNEIVIECEFVNCVEQSLQNQILTLEMDTIVSSPEWHLFGYSQYILMHNPNGLIDVKIYGDHYCVCDGLKVERLGDYFYLIHFDEHSVVTTDVSKCLPYIRDLGIVKLKIRSWRSGEDVTIYQFKFNTLIIDGDILMKRIGY